MSAGANDAAGIIRALNAAGKDARDIAIELVNSGIRPRHGAWSADGVASILRIFGEAPVRTMALTRAAASGPSTCDMAQAGGKPERHKAWREKRKKYHKTNRKQFTDEQKEEIRRLYLEDGMKSGDIAKQLGLHYRKVAPFCALLAGFTVPPGDITEYIDKDGHKVTVFPPGYAKGAEPQKNVSPTYGR